MFISFSFCFTTIYRCKLELIQVLKNLKSHSVFTGNPVYSLTLPMQRLLAYKA